MTISRRICRALTLLTLALLVMSSRGLAVETSPDFKIRTIIHEVERPADGKKYPTSTKEYYRLDSTGLLRYSAYFGGIPMAMNHNDSLDWQDGELGRLLLETAARLVNERVEGVVDMRDDESLPYPKAPGYFMLGVTRSEADSSKLLTKSDSPAWQELATAFSALQLAFEKATGRPLTPGSLPGTRKK